MPMHYSAICAIAKDEDYLLLPWVQYHLWIGFEKIILFDNNSAFPIRNTLAEYINAGWVRVIDLPLTEDQQISAYVGFLREFREHFFWTAFIDLDEFIVLKQADSINAFLADYEDFAGLALSWVVFGSAGHLGIPRGHILEEFTEVLRRDTHIKSIVQPRRVTGVKSPHHFAYAPGSYCVNEDGIPVYGPFSYHTSAKCQINHYYFLSQENFEQKQRRGLATRLGARTGYPMELFYDQAGAATEPDVAILRHRKAVKAFSAIGVPFLQARNQKIMEEPFVAFTHRVSRLLAAGKEKEARSILQERLACDSSLYTELLYIQCLGETMRMEESLRRFRRAFRLAQGDISATRHVFQSLSLFFARQGMAHHCEEIQEFIQRPEVKIE